MGPKKNPAFLKLLLAPMLVLWVTSVSAAPELIDIRSRTGENGVPVMVRAIVDAPAAPRLVLLNLPNGSGLDSIAVKDGKADYGASAVPFLRIRDKLKSADVAVVTLGAPSDQADGITSKWREDPRHFKDIGATIEALKQRYPAAPVYLAGYASAAPSALNYAMDSPAGIAGVILLGGFLADMREAPVGRIGRRGLVLQAITSRCASSPLPEAREIAAKAKFDFVEVAYEKWEGKNTCTASSHNALHGLDAAYADAVIAWLNGATPPARIGAADVQPIFQEQVHYFTAPAAIGSNRLEMTLFLPQGAGPFPLLVFNHGDVPLDGRTIQRKTRYRDHALATVFLDMGLAVAMPARAGIGRSEGRYRHFGTEDADATYKAREHARDIMAAVDYLRQLPVIDKDRIVLTGQSAGGYATMHLASTNPPWMIGAIDFSGGRTTIKEGEIATGINRMMVNGFAEFGRSTARKTLWIFAENDSRYSKETIRACFDAYTAAGGKADLLLSPPIDIDGHHIYHRPEKWQKQAYAYLQEIGAVPAGQAGKQ